MVQVTTIVDVIEEDGKEINPPGKLVLFVHNSEKSNKNVTLTIHGMNVTVAKNDLELALSNATNTGRCY